MYHACITISEAQIELAVLLDLWPPLPVEQFGHLVERLECLATVDVRLRRPSSSSRRRSLLSSRPLWQSIIEYVFADTRS